MQFCIATKKKLTVRPKSATPGRESLKIQKGPAEFCSYFFGEDKECQAVFPEPSVCEELLRSHRRSIGEEVVKIFKASAKTEKKAKKGLKELIKIAKKRFKPVSDSLMVSPVAVSRAKLNEKVRINYRKGVQTPSKFSVMCQVLTPKYIQEKRLRCLRREKRNILNVDLRQKKSLIEDGREVGLI